MKITYLYKLIYSFVDENEYGYEDHYDSPLQRPDVEDMLERAYYMHLRNEATFFATLKQEFFFAFQADEAFWNALNQNNAGEEVPLGEGFHCIASSYWDEIYPEDSVYFVNGADDYHPEMLKLIAKRLIWDILFPNEILPYYTEPKAGWLPRKMNLIKD
ncbi:hypothetical protein [uncultured Shewanella sp.]|uniref:hypothetical protein n=1 Tax=uncultured Shewanella sp. TaxID=173975 RepID=UPI002634CB97|nr:hypothetical protein [uncultured Shewanella sp.]